MADNLYQVPPAGPALTEQAHRELSRLEGMPLEDARTALQAIDPTVFEHLTALLFDLRGYRAQTVGTSGDEGVDVLLRRGTNTSVVQCKRYSDSVGQATIRDLYGTMIHNQAADAFLVTTGNITKKAREWAEGKPIQLIDGTTLLKWIAESADERAPAASKSRPSRMWLWPVLSLLLIGFGIAIGYAFTVFTDRMAASPPAVEESSHTSVTPENQTVVQGEENASPDQNATSQQNETQNESAEDAVTATTTATATPSATSTVTPLPSCQRAVLPEFESLRDQIVLGCPTSDRFIAWAAWQPFEGGYLFWRSDEDTSYSLVGLQEGRWSRLNLGDGAQPVNRGEAPAGLLTPERGFGYLWSTNDELFQNLGWATDKEKGFCAAMQGFDHGLILQSTPVDSCTPNGLYNQAQSADWKPITIVSHADGRWSVNRQLPDAEGSVNSNTQADSITTESVRPESNTTDGATVGVQPAASRPLVQGIFVASAADGISLDGDLADWGNDGWLPISTVVWGNAERSGASDLSGQFQLRWSSTGLWVAIRVTDEAYRDGPFGTNMWQGDGLELHFDRELAEDLASTVMNNDDYQIGISFGPSLNQVTAYRWIPFDVEGSVPIEGTARSTPQGYDAEFRLPWATFAVPTQLLNPGALFGFNLSLNDNDSSAPAQQTTMSASSARTDHKTPTEWGTLALE